MSDDEDPRLCENCEEDVAVIRCGNCESVYCKPCSAVLHKSAKKRDHQLNFLPGYGEAPDLAESIASSVSDEEAYSDSEGGDVDKTVLRPECPDPAQLMDWRAKDVCTWLQYLGSPFDGYCELFESQAIRGPTLPFINDAALTTMGITDGGHRARILDQITRLRMRMQIALVSVLKECIPDPGNVIPSRAASNPASSRHMSIAAKEEVQATIGARTFMATPL